jgi:transcription initiation factor TFIIB
MQTSTVCSLCKSDVIVTDPESGEVICSNCGQVILDKVQESHYEWCAFTVNKAYKRTGMPGSVTCHDIRLYTIIGRTNKDASGNKINVAMRSTIDRLRIWDFRTQMGTYTDKNLRQAFSELDKLKDKLGLSDAIIEKTAYIYRKAQRRGLTRGRTTSGILSAAIYIACREMGTPRTLKDIAAIGNIKRKELARMYRLMVFELDLKIPMVDPIKCIAMIANKVNLSERTKRQAMNIMNDIMKRQISAGKHPMGLAATVLYLSCLNTGESITQTDIACAAGITDMTVRNRFKDLKSQLELKQYLPLLIVNTFFIIYLVLLSSGIYNQLF